MKLVLAQVSVLMILQIFLSSGICIYGVSYDYYATTECLREPNEAQYGGGILTNPEFSNGTNGWTLFGNGGIKQAVSMEGNRYIVSHSRTQSIDGVSQKVHFEQGKLYTFSAWIQISHGSENVDVVFRTSDGGLIKGGRVLAKEGCWSMLKGGISANFSGPVDVLLESENTAVDIWVDNISLQPFTIEEWRSHQEESIEKGRKSRVRFQVTYANGTAVEGARVSILQTKQGFPFGCGMNHNILTSRSYQRWFASRFKYTTFTNEMKWYSTERVQGVVNYTIPDAMLAFCKKNGISVRGHNILWDDPNMQPQWVKTFSADQLRVAAGRRIGSVVRRYSGKVIAWDVMNENLHYSFFEDKLGKNASALYYSIAKKLDPRATMFMNEYNTIEYHDWPASASKYKQKLEEIVSYPGNRGLKAGIGLEGHFSKPDLAYMRSAMDLLASTGFPIWLTEVSVSPSSLQAEYLEQVLMEGFSHPGVKGIIMFAGPATAGFSDTTLVDTSFYNTKAGNVVDKLINQWRSESTEIVTNGEGSFEISLFHGDYRVSVENPSTNSSTRHAHIVAEEDEEGANYFQVIVD